MTHWKKCKVIRLKTNDNSLIQSFQGYIKDFKLKYSENFLGIDHDSWHLYILSDDEIKEGDWYLRGLATPELITSGHTIQELNKSEWRGRKIIATTDTSFHAPHLLIPKLPDSFIKKYCEIGGTDEAMVAYELKPFIQAVLIETDGSYHTGSKHVEIPILKISPDNTIIIKEVKNSWSREEVEVLIEKAFDRGLYGLRRNETKLSIQDVINELI